MNQHGSKPADQMDLVRLKTGIPGLDEMVEGGFPFPSSVLVAGSAGTGKTTFCMQFLTQGANQGEQGLFFTTLSEPTQWMLRFGSRLRFLNRDHFGKLIKYVELGPLMRQTRDPDKLLKAIEDHIIETMPQRIVIDPITVVEDLIEKDYRPFLYDLTTHMKNWQATTVLTGEVLPDQPYPVEVSYIVDGVVLLTYDVTKEGTRKKYLEVLKMRGTAHATGKHLVDVSKDGFSIQVGLR